MTRARESGYTTITFDGHRVSAHRFSYAAFKGDVGSDQEIDHLCRDRACVNPDHLELVTRKENLRRRDTIYDADAWVGDPIKRLMSRVTKTQDSCWAWNGALVRGYGVINIDGKTEYVHRVVFAASGRKFNRSLTLDHICRNPRCVNPDHLEPVTRSENARRMNLAQPRDRCRKGHLYSEYGKTKSGRCIKCYESSPSRKNQSSSSSKPYRQLVRDDADSHCANGHEYSVFGRYPSGNCRKCQAEKDLQRGKRKTTEISEQFCARGHDTWITGRIANGHCKGAWLVVSALMDTTLQSQVKPCEENVSYVIQAEDIGTPSLQKQSSSAPLGTILFNLAEHLQGHAANVLGFTLGRSLAIRRPFKT